MGNSADLTLWGMLVQYPSFLLELLLHPRQLLRRQNWQDHASNLRLSLYLLISLVILLLAFSDSRQLAAVAQPPLSSFKGIMMRAHSASFDWLQPLYGPFGIDQAYAMRSWDAMLMPGFVAWTLFAALCGIAAVARLRMWRFSLDWNHALGTGILGYISLVACQCLALVPLGLLLICRHCGIRLALFILFWLLGWFYLGYYTLADLGERPRSTPATFLRSLGYGLVQAVLASIVFWLLLWPVIPA